MKESIVEKSMLTAGPLSGVRIIDQTLDLKK